MTRTAPLTTVAAIAAVSLLPACDNTSPLSPRALTVLVVAEPATTEMGGVSLVTVSAFDPGGNPAAGVPVVFEASLGSLREPELLLSDTGQASTLFDAGAETGTALVTATATLEGQPASGSTEIEIVEAEAREIEVSPRALELLHSRRRDPCPNRFAPALRISRSDSRPLSYRILDSLPRWLAVDAVSGPIPEARPARVRVLYTCDSGGGDVDLAHRLLIQAFEPSNGEDAGDAVSVDVILRVRD